MVIPLDEAPVFIAIVAEEQAQGLPKARLAQSRRMEVETLELTGYLSPRGLPRGRCVRDDEVASVSTYGLQWKLTSAHVRVMGFGIDSPLLSTTMIVEDHANLKRFIAELWGDV